MYSDLETTIHKLDWVESGYHFDFKMDSNLYVVLSRKLKKKILSCALGLKSNNNLYAVSLNMFSMKKADEEDHFFMTHVEDKKSKPVKLLSEVSPEKVQEFKDTYFDYIEKVREKDIKEMDYFYEKYYGFQKEREIFNRTPIADSMGMIHNFKIALHEFFSFGRYGQKLQLYLDEVTEKAIAWLVLEQTTKNCADDLLEYAKYHKQIDHKELSKQIDEISGFYRNLAYHAHFGGERMRAFQNDVFDVYSLDSSELKLHDIEGIKKKILSKIYT